MTVTITHLGITLTVTLPKKLNKDQEEVIKKDLMISCVRLKNKLDIK